ncbi:hypothetical protein F4778DRAFT_710343 [Xylariomycetidae sp. FL2044]|nr:hypothetical protein F4778DRAFT_710343 [Xylariomycetidae sp. FL2044]
MTRLTIPWSQPAASGSRLQLGIRAIIRMADRHELDSSFIGPHSTGSKPSFSTQLSPFFYTATFFLASLNFLFTMSISISLRQAAVTFLLLGSVVTAQGGELVRRSRFQGKRNPEDVRSYVDEVIRRTGADLLSEVDITPDPEALAAAPPVAVESVTAFPSAKGQPIAKAIPEAKAAADASAAARRMKLALVQNHMFLY